MLTENRCFHGRIGGVDNLNTRLISRKMEKYCMFTDFVFYAVLFWVLYGLIISTEKNFVYSRIYVKIDKRKKEHQ